MPTQPASKTKPAPQASASTPTLTGDLELLARLSNANAVSGDEGAVRAIILEAIRDHVDEVKVDALGNILAVKKAAGKGASKADHVLVAAHMDEVGLMITDIENDGAMRFAVVGGINDNVLLGKAVSVGAKRLPGLIGAMPVHMLPDERRNTLLKANQLRIEIGATSG